MAAIIVGSIARNQNDYAAAKRPQAGYDTASPLLKKTGSACNLLVSCLRRSCNQTWSTHTWGGLVLL